MLMVGAFVSKCPTSLLTDVRARGTNKFQFVCSELNVHLSEESGEHRYKYANHIFTSASLLCKL